MNRTLISFGSCSLLAFGLTLLGCSGDERGVLGSAPDDVSGDASLETLDLDQTYGGLSFTDEADAFGDADLLEMARSADAAALADDEEDSVRGEDPTLDSPRMRQTYLRILWGQLAGEYDRSRDAEAVERLDWSGSIEVSEGAVVLKRTILFEHPFDHRLPRESRDTLAWVSHTGRHFDGVLVKIISPVVDGEAQGVVTFSTPQYENSFRVSELADFELHVDIDRDGNAISFRGQTFAPQRCFSGFTTGVWQLGADLPETEAVEMGMFRGRIMNQNGVVVGFVMGRFGLNAAGERVMAGKYIGRGGRIVGLVAGTWEPAADEAPMGSFQARWVNRMGNVKGTLIGRYRSNGENETGDGFFEGRWVESCNATRGDQ